MVLAGFGRRVSGFEWVKKGLWMGWVLVLVVFVLVGLECKDFRLAADGPWHLRFLVI